MNVQALTALTAVYLTDLAKSASTLGRIFAAIEERRRGSPCDKDEQYAFASLATACVARDAKWATGLGDMLMGTLIREHRAANGLPRDWPPLKSGADVPR